MNKTMRNPYVFALFTVPTLIFFVIFYVYPTVFALRYGFTRWDGVNTAEFIGLQNFVHALKDRAFWQSFDNNVYFILFSIFIQIPVIVILSILISSVRRLQGLYKTFVFVPTILSTAVIGVLWSFIYHPEVGLLNQALRSVGLDSWTHAWTSDPKTAMLSILVTNAWQWTGFYVVLVLAAIFGIPKEILESAELDGASGWRKAIHITVPLVRGVLLVIILLSVTGAMKALDIVYVMTGGGPFGMTDVMATYMLNNAFQLSQYGYGNAIAILITLLTLLLTVLFRGVTSKLEGVEY